jgi:hypothetical protein
MNQISPKMFEAIATRTALILFEGSYSDILKPDVHFLPLKKDFSNVDEVLAKVADVAVLEKLTERAHEDVIGSGKYDLAKFIERVDGLFSAEVPRGARLQLLTSVSGYVGATGPVRLPATATLRATAELRPEVAPDLPILDPRPPAPPPPPPEPTKWQALEEGVRRRLDAARKRFNGWLT